MTTEAIARQLGTLLEKYSGARDRADQSEHGRFEHRERSALLTQAHAAIERVARPGTPYITRCRDIVGSQTMDDEYRLELLIGIVEALRDDYWSGALAPLHELIRAEVFDDFIVMSEHLLDNGYKDAAAVLTGGVLEAELRKLAERATLPVDGVDGRPLKAASLNAELHRKAVYNLLDQKSVTSWLDLRNNAAHGKYDEYTVDQVKAMLMGVRHFVSRMSGAAA